MYIKYSLQVDLTYWGNFIVCIFVELAYQGAFLAFFAVLFTQTNSIAGWDINQLIILLGIDTIGSELVTGTIIVWNSRELPQKIWSGELDRILLRPIHPLFTLMLGRPYFPSFVSTLSGLAIAIYGLSRIGFQTNIINVVGALIFFILGYILVFYIITFFSLLTFFFQDTVTIPRIGERIVYSFSGRPHDMFTGALKIVFFLIFPVVYVASFSAKTLFAGPDFLWLSILFCLVIAFSVFTKWLWDGAISRYSSASS